jgi:hypothetical protein
MQKLEKYFPIILMLICALVSKRALYAQCNSFNINFNFNNPINHLSDPVKCKNGDYIISSWYVNSCGVNEQPVTDLTSNVYEKSTIYRIDSLGQIIQQISLQDKISLSNFGPIMDSSENIYVPVMNAPHNLFQINDTLMLREESYTTYGFIKISKNFKSVIYTPIGRTNSDKTRLEYSKLSMTIFNNKIYVNLPAKEDVVLANEQVIIHDSSSVLVNHLVRLELNGNIIDQSVLSRSNLETFLHGWEHVNNKLFVLMEYNNSIFLPSINKLQRASPKNPRIPFGFDLAILEISEGELIKSYNIGSSDRIMLVGVNKKIFFENNRYVFAFGTGINGIYDDQNQYLGGGDSLSTHAVAILDTNFTHIKYISIKNYFNGTISYLNLFDNSDGSTMLYTVSENWILFQNDIVGEDLNSWGVGMFKLQGDSFVKLEEFKSTNYRFLIYDYSSQGLLTLLYRQDVGKQNNFWGYDLNPGYYSKNAKWFGRFCNDNLSIPENENNDNQLIIYPIPTSDKLNIKTSKMFHGICQMKIWNTQGILLHTQNVEHHSQEVISLETPASLRSGGIYIVELTTENGECLREYISIQ